MGRRPLAPDDDGNTPQCNYVYGDHETDWAGRVRLLEFVGDDEQLQDEIGGLLATAEQAEEVRLLLDTPSGWETIGVSQSPSRRNPRTLGFDIGWFGEWYSLIGDCIVAPIWHPPDEEDLPELASQATALNQHLLFDTVDGALRFRDWYRTKRWAESETADNARELQAKGLPIDEPFIVFRIDSIT